MTISDICSPSNGASSSSSIPSSASCKIITASERKIKEAESRQESCSSDNVGDTDGTPELDVGDGCVLLNL